MDKTKETMKQALKSFLPPEKVHLDEWVEKNLELDAAEPGKMNLRKTPYMREILRSITDPSIEKVTWQASARVGKTQLCLAIAAYYTEHEPSPILFVEPSVAIATYISDLYTKQANHNPRIKRLLEDKGSKDNIIEKSFPGGSLYFASAESYNQLIAKTFRIILLDEVDAWKGDLKGRGNPLQLAKDRSMTYANRKIITVSVPGTEGLSNVSKSYQLSDMREYHCPCPHCGVFQELVFRNLHWLPDSNGVGAWYECEACRERIDEHQRAQMVGDGIWIATNPTPEPRHAGFRVNQFCSLLGDASFDRISTRFLEAKRDGDVATLKVFINQIFGETWNDNHITRIAESEIMERSEYYNAEVPLGVGVLEAGIDCQANRVEISVYGYGKDKHQWLIDHKVIHGDIEQDPASPNSQLYVDLDQYLNRAFSHESGRDIYIRSAFVDVGDGNRTQQIRRFCFSRMNRNIFACMGAKRPILGIFTGANHRDELTKHPIFFVDKTKSLNELTKRLNVKYNNQSGYLHFPRLPHIGEDFYKQLTNFKPDEKFEKGVLTFRYLPRFKNTREEVNDCWRYAYAAFLKDWGDRLAILDEVCDYMITPYTPEVEEAMTPEEMPKSSASNFFEARKRILGA